MKEANEIIIGRLKTHIELLISNYEQLKLENDELNKQLTQQLKKTETFKLKIKELSDKIDALETKENSLKLKQEEQQLKYAFETVSGDTESAKKTIDKIIAEIDNCIFLLDE